MKKPELNNKFFLDYKSKLCSTLDLLDWDEVRKLFWNVHSKWKNGNSVYLCGNGGSAGNAIHLANDLLFGIGNAKIRGLAVHALAANSAVLTCLGNDEGYENIYSEQLAVMGKPGDLVIIFSGSGNSPNVIKVLKQAKSMQIESCAILGFDGGMCKDLADITVHFPVNDMQISEDLQLIVGHMLMKWLSSNPPEEKGRHEL